MSQVPRNQASFLAIGSLQLFHGRSKRIHSQSPISRAYGGVYSFRYLFFRRLSVADPEAIKHILVSNAKNYPRGRVPRAILKEFTGGIGLLSSEDPIHNAQRKMLHPQFTQAKLKTFVSLFASHAQEFAKMLYEALVKDSNSSPIIDMQSDMTKLSLDIIGDAAFGFDFGALTNSNPEIMAAFEILNHTPSVSFALGTTFIPWFDRLPLASIQRRQEAKRLLVGTVDTIIQKRLERASTANSTAPSSINMLDLMLEATEYTPSPEEARVHVMTFMIAGHETTSNTLAWVWAMLASHPEVEARAVKECTSVLVASNGQLTWDSLGQLEYLTAVIHETLRLHPTVFNVTARSILQDDTIPRSKGPPFHVSKGGGIRICIAALHRNPEYWTRPEEFLPDRFIQGTELYRADESLRGGRGHTFIFMPFSAGPKNCIGQRFAVAEMQVVLTTLLTQFTFKFAPGQYDLTPKFTGVTIKPKQLNMQVARRVKIT
ncbi:hypothetical protein Ae201684P_014097 [Aphanomyces euteiches]|nr:hypothetical protein Ae201684P_014097 [Aphanomyces euteiches]